MQIIIFILAYLQVSFRYLAIELVQESFGLKFKCIFVELNNKIQIVILFKFRSNQINEKNLLN